MNKSKIKGTAWETAIARYLAPLFPDVERRALTGAQDRGDIAGVPGVVIEAKNCQTMTLAAWLDEAVAEQANAAARVGVVWHKRRGRLSPADAYVTMTGRQFVALLVAAGIGGGPSLAAENIIPAHRTGPGVDGLREVYES